MPGPTAGHPCRPVVRGAGHPQGATHPAQATRLHRSPDPATGHPVAQATRADPRPPGPTPGHPQGVALLYTTWGQRDVYSRATPCGWPGADGWPGPARWMVPCRWPGPARWMLAGGLGRVAGGRGRPMDGPLPVAGAGWPGPGPARWMVPCRWPAVGPGRAAPGPGLRPPLAGGLGSATE